MLKIFASAVVFSIFLLAATVTTSGSQLQIASQANSAELSIDNKKRNKNNQLPPAAQEFLKPIVELKRAIEAELPQKELNTIKRLAFRVLILARKFL